MIERLGLEQIDGSGATRGQVPVWNPDNGGTWNPGTVSGSGSGLPWFNVKDYGAAGDGTADDAAEINAAIADLNTAGRGVLYFPALSSALGAAGRYKITADLTTITAHAIICGDGAGDFQAQNAATSIHYDSTTGTVFTLAGDGTLVRDLALENSTALTHTAGAGIHVTQGDSNRFSNVSVRGFYDCVNIEDGASWAMSSCLLIDPVRYGLYIRHVDSVDGGDWNLTDSTIIAGVRNATSALRQESGGGGRIVGLKVNSYGTGYFSFGVDATITNAATSNLIITASSIENVATSPVRVTHTGTGSFAHVHLDAVQTAQYQAGSTPAIDISSVSRISLDGLILVASPSRSVEAIRLTSVTDAVIGQRIVSGYSTAYATSSSTNVVDATAGSGGSSLTVQDESSNVATGVTQIDFQGAGVTATAGTGEVVVTIPGATSTTGELLMQDGVTGPPVPIETEARDDWLYQG